MRKAVRYMKDELRHRVALVSYVLFGGGNSLKANTATACRRTLNTSLLSID